MYMTEVPNYFLPNAVHVPRIKFFTSTKICLLLLLCQNWGCIVYVKNMVVVFPFTTRKFFSVLHSKKIWNYIYKKVKFLFHVFFQTEFPIYCIVNFTLFLKMNWTLNRFTPGPRIMWFFVLGKSCINQISH